MLEAARVALEFSATRFLLARDADAGIFAMTYYDPSGYPVWKQELREGRVEPGFSGPGG